MSIPFESIKQASLAHATRLLPEWFPYGKLSGREFEVGSLQGEHGKSLKINVDTGLWKDFATGECGGDLIDLRAAITRETLAEAATSLAASLGVQATNGNGNGHAARNAWTPIIPPPTGTEPPHAILRQFDTVYDYTDANDRVTHYVGRTERGNDRKSFTPITYGVLNGAKGWHRKGPTAPRPLYGLNRLASMPQATVIVCEGEKAADAAQRMLPDYACVAWSNGAEAWSKSDWSPLAGRKVIVWPDNDAPGHKAAKALAPGIFAKILRVDDLPESADAADVEVDEDWISARLSKQPTEEGFEASPLDWDAMCAVPPREWIYGHFLIKRFISVLGAPGGTGKTAYSFATALSVATGRELLGEKVHETGNVWIYNLEDPKDELLRRFYAACLHHGVQRHEIEGRIFLDSGRDRRLVIATKSSDGTLIVSPVKDQIIAEIKRRNILMLKVDPFIKSHQLEENSNDDMDYAASLWADVADKANCSIELVHHFKKGGVSGDAAAFRGASAVIDASRAAQSMSGMTEKEAERFGQEVDKRWQFVRMDNAKLNLAPPPDKATWLKLIGVDLRNARNGRESDTVQTVERWEPPSAWDGMPMSMVVRILDKIDAGPEEGEYYALGKQAKDRWAGQVLMDDAGRTEEQAKLILSSWKDSGIIEEGQYSSRKNGRRMTGCIRANPDKVSEMRRQIVSLNTSDE